MNNEKTKTLAIQDYELDTDYVASLNEWYDSRHPVTQDELDAAWAAYDNHQWARRHWATNVYAGALYCIDEFEGMLGELITEEEASARCWAGWESDEIFSRAVSYRMAA